MAPEKFKALVLYVIAKCGDPARLGATRLNKILWFSDSFAYRINGVSITGEAYVKRQWGPVPKHILATIRELEADSLVITRGRQHLSHRMHEFVAPKRAGYQHCSEKHLHRYLAEFDFRYNERNLTDSERAMAALTQVVGKRLTYKYSSSV